MANISAIKLPDNTTYDIKDNVSGYITSYTETDPIFSASAAAGITSSDISNWNSKQATLVSGTNIKTINNTSLLGSGNLDISSSGEAENITQAEYDALTPAQKSDGTIYFIYDGTPTPSPTPVSNLQNLVDGSATASVRGVGTAAESGSYTMGTYAFAEGYSTKARGTSSHAEGYQVIASGSYSHAEGNNTEAVGDMSHAEGSGTIASGDGSHAEGAITTASGNYGSHAEGYDTIASGRATHAQNLGTIAQRMSQTTLGEYNIADTTGTTATRGDYVVIVGNGTADNARSNALTVDWSGNVDIASGAHYKINGSNLSASDVGALPNTTVIPTKTSDLTNDSGFITSYTETDPIFTASAAHDISASDITNWNSKQAALVSGTNIKTINNTSILGSGNISIQNEPEIFIATYGVTTYANVAAAYNAGKIIYCKRTQTYSESTVDSLLPLIGMTNTIIGEDSFIVYNFGTSGSGETVRITLSELPPYWHLEEIYEMQIIRWTEVVGE